MSYATIARCAVDTDLMPRVTAALAQENVVGSAPSVIGNYMWEVASASDIEAAYASALVAENPSPGGDETVITDGMILAFVQANPPVFP